MTKWKYLKGSEKDFEGAPEWATECVWNDKGGESFCYWLSTKLKRVSFNGLVVEWDGEYGWRNYVKAQREPITAADVEVVKYDQMKVDIESLVAERRGRYGKFKDGAKIMRDLKHVMHEVDGWNNLSPSQREALDMIQHKIGRILNGDPAYDDNWKDISGYSKLIADELNVEIK